MGRSVSPTHPPNALHYNTFSKVYVKSVCTDFLFLTNLRLESVCSRNLYRNVEELMIFQIFFNIFVITDNNMMFAFYNILLKKRNKNEWS